jgi:hypothetical protein
LTQNGLRGIMSSKEKDYLEAKRLIKRCKEKKIKELDLSKFSLEKIPDEQVKSVQKK